MEIASALGCSGEFCYVRNELKLETLRLSQMDLCGIYSLNITNLGCKRLSSISLQPLKECPCVVDKFYEKTAY